MKKEILNEQTKFINKKEAVFEEKERNNWKIIGKPYSQYVFVSVKKLSI